MNSTDEKDVSLLGEDFYQFKKNGIPLTTYLIVLCVVGTIGNLHVIVIYLLRYKPSIYKTFVLCLTSVDLLGCAFSIPFTLFILRYPNSLQSSAFCKLTRTLSYFSGACSLALLDVIAVERYRKVCHATRAQFTLRTARIVCACVIGVAFTVVVVPVTIIYGINRRVTRYYSLDGYECTVLNELKNSVFVKIYRGAIFVLCIILLVICVVLYSMVGRTLYKHQDKRNKAKMDNSASGSSFTINSQDSNTQTSHERIVTKTSSQDTDTSNRTCTHHVEKMASSDRNNKPIITVSHICLTEEQQMKDRKNCVGDKGILEAQVTVTSTKKVTCNSKLDTSSNGKQKSLLNLTKSKSVHIKRSKSGKNQLKKSKNITMIFLVVSVISFGGYLPYLIVTLIRNIDQQIYSSFAHSQGALDLLIRWMFYLNNAINPLVYGFLDKKFRKELLLLYKKLKNNVCCINCSRCYSNDT